MKQGAVQVQHCVNTHRPTQTDTRGLSDYNCMGPEAFSFPCAMDGACWPFSIFFLFLTLILIGIFLRRSLYFSKYFDENSKYSSALHSPEGSGRNGTKKIEVRWVRASRLARIALRSVGGLCNGGDSNSRCPCQQRFGCNTKSVAVASWFFGLGF